MPTVNQELRTRVSNIIQDYTREYPNLSQKRKDDIKALESAMQDARDTTSLYAAITVRTEAIRTGTWIFPWWCDLKTNIKTFLAKYPEAYWLTQDVAMLEARPIVAPMAMDAKLDAKSDIKTSDNPQLVEQVRALTETVQRLERQVGEMRVLYAQTCRERDQLRNDNAELKRENAELRDCNADHEGHQLTYTATPSPHRQSTSANSRTSSTYSSAAVSPAPPLREQVTSASAYSP